jgi:hypothetical protein
VHYLQVENEKEKLSIKRSLLQNHKDSFKVRFVTQTLTKEIWWQLECSLRPNAQVVTFLAVCSTKKIGQLHICEIAEENPKYFNIPIWSVLANQK